MFDAREDDLDRLAQVTSSSFFSILCESVRTAAQAPFHPGVVLPDSPVTVCGRLVHVRKQPSTLLSGTDNLPRRKFAFSEIT
jgi:hypothetical protein